MEASKDSNLQSLFEQGYRHGKEGIRYLGSRLETPEKRDMYYKGFEIGRNILKRNVLQLSRLFEHDREMWEYIYSDRILP